MLARTYSPDEWKRLTNEYDKVKVRCSCGRRVIIPVWVDKQLCDWCGHYVYRDKKLEFKEKLKQKGIKANAKEFKEEKY